MTDGDPVIRAEVRDTAQNPRSKAGFGAKTQGHEGPGDRSGFLLSESQSLELEPP